MKNLFAPYAATFTSLLLLDLLWLGVIAAPIYQAGIGHLMAEKPNIPIAALFYVIYPIGLMHFGVLSLPRDKGWRKAAASGALFGFFTYATYDLTNLALLRDWPFGMSLIDIIWGTTVSGVATAVGRLIFVKFPSS
jgi:uncharacterized membrane protein